ncbi:MAG TPA: VOC family protein [Streptosporangiaceae bacterium]|nr:VOC family protein [Streptosporangiaceae bacterium]
MAVRYQLVINCIEPEPQALFWAAALGYIPAPPPEGFASWEDYQRDLGVPEMYRSKVVDRISDPQGHGPNIWFQVVQDRKTITNRLHFDINAGGGDRSLPFKLRKQQVEDEAARLVALGATRVDPADADDDEDDAGHYAVAMRDPEGNEFDIN